MSATRFAFAVALMGLAACSRAAAPPEGTPSSPTGPVAADPHILAYVCDDGRRVTAGYPDRETAILTLGDHSYPLKIAMSASGARYTGFGLQWWTKGTSWASLAPLRPGEDIASASGVECRPAP